MLIGIQIISLVFALFMMYWVFLYYKKREITFLENLIWQLVWLGFIYLTFLPHTLSFLIEKVNITRVMDLAMILAFMILTVLGFSNYIRGRQLERKIEKIIRKLALKEMNEE